MLKHHGINRLRCRFWVIVCICFAVPLAKAQTITLRPEYDYITNQSGAAILKAPATANLQASNDAIIGTSRITIAGKQVVIPARYRLAANASQYAVNAIRQMNPALLGLSLLAYLALENIQTQNGQYVKPGYSTTPTTNGWYLEYTNQWPCHSGPTYRSDLPSRPHGCNSPEWQNYTNDPQIDLYGYYQYNQVSCGWMGIWRSCVAPIPSPATEQDWQSLQQRPLPIPAAIDLAKTPHGVPVIPELQPQPIDYPLGAPYSHPDGSWRQPMVRITPLPDGTVQAVPWERKVTGPQTGPDGIAEPLPGEAPIMRPDITQEERDRLRESERQQPEEQDRPDYDVPADSIPSAQRTVAFAPVSIPAASGCPSDRQASTPWGALTLSYQYACTAADYIRPIVIALASFAAVLLFVGGLRDD